MRIPICRGCGEIVPLNANDAVQEWSKRLRCDECLTRWDMKRAALIEDVEWLLSTGCGWHEIAHRLHSTGGALERRLHRAGRHDLAAVFHPADRRAAA